MDKMSAQRSYLRYLKEKNKRATITKQAQMPMLIDPDTQQRLYQHNVNQMRTAGGLLGAGSGILGGGALGAGIGALAAGAGKRLRGAGYGGLAGAAGGALLGGLFGPGVGQELAGDATSKDIAQLNQLAQQRLLEAGINPFYGDIGVSARFGKNTGDDRPFSIEDYYLK